MKFIWVTMMVDDLFKTQKFYEDILGLRVSRTIEAEGKTRIVFLGDGDTQVELIHSEGNKEIGRDISLGFAVESLDKILELVRNKNIEIVSDIIKPNPYIKFFYVLDPNGTKIQFVENSK